MKKRNKSLKRIKKDYNEDDIIKKNKVNKNLKKIIKT